MNNTLRLQLLLLFVTFVQVTTLGKNIEPNNQLDFKIYRVSGGYFVGKPISIVCRIRNNGDEEVEILLKDHDDYHGTLLFPTTMTVTVWNEQGEILVSDWSSYVLWSTFFFEMPGDRIKLKPEEEITRFVPLGEILKGSSMSLDSGVYRIQLKLPEVMSNTLNITVLDERG